MEFQNIETPFFMNYWLESNFIKSP